MTRRLAAAIMLLVVAGTVAFLYYYSRHPVIGEASPARGIFGAESYDIDESDEISLDALSGVDASSVSATIVVRYRDVSVLSAHFYGNVRLTDGSPVPELSVTEQGGVARIEVEPRGFSPYLMSSSDLTLEVTVPQRFEGSLSAKSVSGEIFVESGARAKAVDLENVSGKVSVGELYIEGPFKAGSVSGAIETEHVSCRSFSAKTVSGAIDAKRVTEAESIDLGSVSGSINLGLGDGEQFSISASSLSGSISCDFPLRIESSTSKKLVGTTGDGSLDLDISTVSGSINVDAL